MSVRKFTPEETQKLQRAYDLIADVQVPMAKTEDGWEWDELFQIRAKLGREIYNRKTE